MTKEEIKQEANRLRKIVDEMKAELEVKAGKLRKLQKEYELTIAELEARERQLLIDHHKWYRKWRLSVNDSSVETTVDEFFKHKETQK